MTTRPRIAVLSMRVAALLAATLAASLGSSTAARAQMLGVPVLQNGFANRGLGVAGNFASTDGGSAYGAAAAFSPSGRRIVLSGGIGTFSPDGTDALGRELDSQLTYGLRAALTIFRFLDGAVGVAPFAGAGRATVDMGRPAAGAADSSDGKVHMLHVPAGVAVGYRRALGATRAVSVYGAPFYSWNRSTLGDSSTTGGVLRVSLGLDVALLQSVGLTLGYETGATAKDGEVGPRSGIFGAGLSYAFGARR